MGVWEYGRVGEEEVCSVFDVRCSALDESDPSDQSDGADTSHPLTRLLP